MQIEVGVILDGKVTGITNFGAFVDLGEGKSGMVHISEVAPTYVADINEHITMGQQVKVKVLSISDVGKISLSIKRTVEQPHVDSSRPVGPRPAGPRSDGPRPAGPRPVGPRPAGFRPAVAPRVKAPAKPASPDDYQRDPNEPVDQNFENMLNKFKQSSTDRFSDLKRKNPDAGRTRKR